MRPSPLWSDPGHAGRTRAEPRTPHPAAWPRTRRHPRSGTRQGASGSGTCGPLPFGVILVTLVGQGLSLGPLIRLLGLEQDGTLDREHAKAHLVAAHAALSRLE